MCRAGQGEQQPWENEVSYPARDSPVESVESVESEAWAASPGRHSHQMSSLSPRVSSAFEENYHFLLLIPTPSPACFHFLGKSIKSFISKTLLSHKRIDRRLQGRYFHPAHLLPFSTQVSPSALLTLCKGPVGEWGGGGRRGQISSERGIMGAIP